MKLKFQHLHRNPADGGKIDPPSITEALLDQFIDVCASMKSCLPHSLLNSQVKRFYNWRFDQKSDNTEQ